jgi:hypothetical protein
MEETEVGSLAYLHGCSCLALCLGLVAALGLAHHDAGPLHLQSHYNIQQ